MSDTLNIHQKLMNIQATLKAPKNQFNAFGKYNYRSCEDILEGLKPILSEVGAIVTLTDEIVQIGERYYVKATAKITDVNTDEYVTASAFAREDIEKKGMDLAQVTGSVSSYARKYALNGLFCIDDTKDSDSTNQHGKEKDKPPAKKETTPPPPSWGGSQKPPQALSSGGEKTITEAQQKRLYAICKNHGVPNAEVKEKIAAFGFASSKDLDKATYDLVCEWAENYDNPDNFTMPEEEVF